MDRKRRPPCHRKNHRCSRVSHGMLAAFLLLLSTAAKAETGFTAIQLVGGPKAGPIETRYVELLRDRIAEITTARVSVGALPRAFSGLVVEIGTIASHPELAARAKLTRHCAARADSIRGRKDSCWPRKTVRGNRSCWRSAAIAAACFTRSVKSCGGWSDAATRVLFPRVELQLRCAPRWPVRGLIVSQGYTMRQLTGARAWTKAELQRAHLDYALAGANTFELDENERPRRHVRLPQVVRSRHAGRHRGQHRQRTARMAGKRGHRPHAATCARAFPRRGRPCCVSTSSFSSGCPLSITSTSNRATAEATSRRRPPRTAGR